MLLYVVCTAGELVWNEGGVVQLPAPCKDTIIEGGTKKGEEKILLCWQFQKTDEWLIKSVTAQLSCQVEWDGF